MKLVHQYNYNMNTNKNLIEICQYFSEILGPSSEVILHNAKTGEIEWINEGALSKRNIGDKSKIAILKLINSKCINENTNRIVGALNVSEPDRLIRTNNLMIRDDDGKVLYCLSINQDVSGFAQIEPFIKNLFAQQSKINLNFDQIGDNEDIEDIMVNIILEETKHADIYKLNSKEAKLNILKRLSARGVFKVRQSVPKVCEILEIAQPTLYKYLKQIEQEQE